MADFPAMTISVARDLAYGCLKEAVYACAMTWPEVIDAEVTNMHMR